MTHFSEMRAPPQNQESSTKRATIQGHWFSAASSPPTILSLAGGPSIPHSAARSYADGWGTGNFFGLAGEILMESLLGRGLGLYLLRSLAAAAG